MNAKEMWYKNRIVTFIKVSSEAAQYAVVEHKGEREHVLLEDLTPCAKEMFEELGYKQNNPQFYSERNGHVISYKKTGVTDDFRKSETIKRITFCVKERRYSIFNIRAAELGEDKYIDIEINSKEHLAYINKCWS